MGRVKLSTYQLEECYDCQCDYVAIYRDNLYNRTLVKSCYPSQYIFKTRTNELFAEFVTDTTSIMLPSYSASAKSGFNLLYQEVTPSIKQPACYKQIRQVKTGFSRKGVITSTGLYEDNVDCTWEVTAEANARIRYIVRVSWIERCTQCSCDYLIIGEDRDSIINGTNKRSHTIMRDCGESSYTSSPSLTSGNKLFVRFVTDSSISAPQSSLSRTGFEVSFEEVPSTLCKSTNYVKNRPNGTIQNFEFPKLYHNNVRCQWLITVSYGARIRLFLNVSWIEGSPDCAFDYVAVYDGHSRESSEPISKICQSYQQSVLTTTTNAALVYFYTDAHSPELPDDDDPATPTIAGFQITYEEIWDGDKSRSSFEARDTNLKVTISISVAAAIVVVAIIAIAALVAAWYRTKRNMVIAPPSVVALNNYIVPASNFQELLRDIGSEELRRMINKLSIESDWLKIDDANIVGSGNFGVVNKAWLQRPGQASECVAVKSLKSGRSDDIVDFLKEASIQATFDHPNVLILLGVAILFEQPRVIVPFMENGNLRNFLKTTDSGNAYSEFSLVKFCEQVCCGMEYLSSKACIHRDLAARNVLVSKEQILKISDFGMARYVRQDGCYRYMGGKAFLLPVRWHPPESLLFGSFESKSDVWSFGVVCWEILSVCETEPYHDCNVTDVIEQVCNGKRLSKPSRCSDNFYQHIMAPCWYDDRRNRPTFSDLLPCIRQYLVQTR